MKLPKRLASSLLIGLAFFAECGWSQTIDNLEWVEGAKTPTARITFAANVRFLRQAPASSSWTDLSQVRFQIVAADDSVMSQTVGEGKHLQGSQDYPSVDLRYEVLPKESTKLINLLFGENVVMLARQGPGARTIDLEFLNRANEGAMPKMANAPEDRNFAVILDSAVVGKPVPMPRIPSDLQDYTVFTKIVDRGGLKQDDLMVGYFKTEKEAQKVAQVASKSFPGASVFNLESTTEPAVQRPVPVIAKVETLADPVEVNPAPLLVAPVAEPRQEEVQSSLFIPTPAPESAKPEVNSANLLDRDVVAKPSIPVLAPVVAESKIVDAAVPDAVAVVPAGASQSPEEDAKGKDFLDKGLVAMNEHRYKDAVDLMNQSLLIPPNASSELSQELIGMAWEALENFDRARTEYQLYLKLYPQGVAAQRVSTRLNGLGKAAPATASKTEAKKTDKNKLSATGSVSQYYYGGNTKTDSLVNIAAGIDQNTISRTSQSVLVSSWDATAKYATDDSETKLIMRGSHSDNLMQSSALTTATQGLISAAYVDYRNLNSKLGLRLGRQSAIGGSMFGLFDGVSMAMPFADKYKVDAMIGVPANTLVNAPQQTVAGVMVEADNLFTNWGGNLSLVEQTTEGISDRRAVGIEARYFGDSLSMYSQLEYELNFGALNAATVQGSLQGPFDTTVTVLIDDRKAPSLQLSDALISSGATSLSTMLQLRSLSEVQNMALSTAAEARQAMFSLSRAISPKWQGSLDVRFSDISALPAVGNFQAQPATGAQYTGSIQLTGSNLYSNRDINGFNLSVISSPTIDGIQLAYSNLTGVLGGKGSLEPSLRYYHQTDNTGTTISRISPGLRFSYKLAERSSVMGETIYESSQTDGPANHETSSSLFFYMGYRHDFQ